jgi:hypothetical protein
MLRRTFGPKRDEVIGSWRKVPSEELHNFYSSPNIIRMIKSRRTRCTVGEEECIYSLMGKPEGKRPLGKPRR